MEGLGLKARTLIIGGIVFMFGFLFFISGLSDLVRLINTQENLGGQL